MLLMARSKVMLTTVPMTIAAANEAIGMTTIPKERLMARRFSLPVSLQDDTVRLYPGKIKM
jgi:hypothetical protein